MSVTRGANHIEATFCRRFLKTRTVADVVPPRIRRDNRRTLWESGALNETYSLVSACTKESCQTRDKHTRGRKDIARPDFVVPGQPPRRIFMRRYLDEVLQTQMFLRVAVEESDEIRLGVIADFGYEGRVVGFEILQASKIVEQAEEMQFAVAG